MSLLVIGSIALDTIKTPFGELKEGLGGSAVYFAFGASFFTKVNMVGAVGTDFPEEHLHLLKKQGVDLHGVEKKTGDTFRWTGQYDNDLNSRTTLSLDLNVFENFNPVIPPEYSSAEYVFLGNIDPDIQDAILQQLKSPKFVGCDTIDFWIKNKKDSLKQLLKKVNLFTLNDSEAREFSGEYNLIKAARFIHSCGPKMVIIKKGEHGVLFFNEKFNFSAPAYPVEEVRDPTGAGDTFAGGFMGYVEKNDSLNEETLRKAVVFGSITASYTVEDFSTRRLERLTREEITKRYKAFEKLTGF